MNNNNNQIQRYEVYPTYSNIVIYNNTVYLSGQVPWQTANLDDFILQVREVFSLIDDKLNRAGTNKSKILSLQVFLTDSQNYNILNEQYLQWMPNNYAPTRNTICNVTFPNPHWMVEMVVVAAL
jgi:enamine deaminase RidA (YjgF/YER057c/UK114 family)